MFYELLNILNFDYFNYREEFFNRKKIRKAKKKAKKAKKEANTYTDIIEDETSETIDEIKNATNNNPSTSICDPNMLPIKEDLNLLLDKLEETENNIKNDDNTNKINDFYDKYINSINFNNQYQKNLLDYEKELLSYTYGENYYDEILKKRDIHLNIVDSSNLFNSDFYNLDENLQKSIFINKEINKNQTILEKNIESLQDEKKQLENKINNTKNVTYVFNRDSYYDNNLNSYYLSLIQIILYFYSFFYIIYFLQEINKSNFSYFELLTKLLILALLPNIIFDNFIYIIHKIINFF